MVKSRSGRKSATIQATKGKRTFRLMAVPRMIRRIAQTAARGSGVGVSVGVGVSGGCGTALLDGAMAEVDAGGYGQQSPCTHTATDKNRQKLKADAHVLSVVAEK